ncbi:hypothetical protein ACFSJ3_00410 [Corallincola platygyrae]|uniref:DUF3887 domain-containing protein n=1 Tax=Corallincola platygyrae TaxID=1193278 RepID=A0ABW4XIB7_9GAMM
MKLIRELFLVFILVLLGVSPVYAGIDKPSCESRLLNVFGDYQTIFKSQHSAGRLNYDGLASLHDISAMRGRLKDDFDDLTEQEIFVILSARIFGDVSREVALIESNEIEVLCEADRRTIFITYPEGKAEVYFSESFLIIGKFIRLNAGGFKSS